MDGFQFQDSATPLAQSGGSPPLAPAPSPRSRRGMLALAALLAAGAVAMVLTQVTGARADQAPEVRQVVKTYETAMMSADGATACAQLTPAAVQQLLQTAAGVGQGNSCVEVARSVKRYVDTLISQAPTSAKAAAARRMIEDPPVKVVTVHGDTATAKISGEDPFPLVHTDGGWKISGFHVPG